MLSEILKGGGGNKKRKILTVYFKKLSPFRKAAFSLCESSEDKGRSSEALFDLGPCNHK